MSKKLLDREKNGVTIREAVLRPEEIGVLRRIVRQQQDAWIARYAVKTLTRTVQGMSNQFRGVHNG